VPCHQCDTYDALCAFDKICKRHGNKHPRALLVNFCSDDKKKKIAVCVCEYALACTNIMVVLVIRKPRAGNCVFIAPLPSVKVKIRNNQPYLYGNQLDLKSLIYHFDRQRLEKMHKSPSKKVLQNLRLKIL
jgi:hypothetical protein